MSRKPEMVNLLYGSFLGGSLIAAWIRFVVTYIPEEEALAYLVLIAIGLSSVITTQKFSQKPLKSWLFLTAIIASAAFIFFNAFQAREIWIFFVLPAAALIAGLINLMVFLVRRQIKNKTGLKEEEPTSDSPAKGILISMIVIFILPVTLSGYMHLFSPPLIETSYPRIVVYDYVWKGNEGSENGLLLYCDPDRKGDNGRYDWIAAAYLISREWFDNPEEIWKDEKYVRRARFYRSGVLSFERNERQDFESRRCTEDLFLPYQLIQKKVSQGNFTNYRAEPIEIISSSNRVQFAVEFITVVADRKGKKAIEGEYGAEKRLIIPLDADATPFAGKHSGDERYFNSEWLAMVSGLSGDPAIIEEKEIPSEDVEIADDLGEL